jgi:hypothetical protein
MSELTELYLNQLGEKELIAYNIAIELLGSSFNLELSIGYIKWYKEYNHANI